MSGYRPKSSLETAIDALPNNSPETKQLLACHMSVARYVIEIVGCESLVPRRCSVFDKDHIYFSYGAPHYRPRHQQTQDRMEFPIAFVLNSEALKTMSGFYPFDTGAMAGGSFGDAWKKEFDPLGEYSIASLPERLVACFYGSNDEYLMGKTLDLLPTGSTEPMQTVHKFLSQDLSKEGIDQRQRTIECISEVDVPLTKYLLWIGYPNNVSAEIAELWKRFRQGFRFYEYVADVNGNPAQLAKHLEMKAREEFNYLVTGPTHKNGS